MELTSVTGIIRIPVADPASRKEGVLSISLPRDCFEGSTPRFYAEDARRACETSHPSAPASSDGCGTTTESLLTGLERVIGAMESCWQGPADASTGAGSPRESGVGAELGYLVVGGSLGLEGARDFSGGDERGAGGGDPMQAVRRGLSELAHVMDGEPDRYASVLETLARARGLVDSVARVTEQAGADVREAVGQAGRCLQEGREEILRTLQEARCALEGLAG